MKKSVLFTNLVLATLLAFSINARAGDVMPMDQISFNYGKIEFQRGSLWLVGEDGKKSLITKNGDYQTTDGKTYRLQNGTISPRDAASGLPTGKRQHKPLTISKPVDKNGTAKPANIKSNQQPEAAALLLPAVQSASEPATGGQQ